MAVRVEWESVSSGECGGRRWGDHLNRRYFLVLRSDRYPLLNAAVKGEGPVL